MYRDDAFAAFFFIAFTAFFAIEALNYPLGTSLRKVGPGFFPLVCLAFLCIFSVLLLVKSIRDWPKKLRANWPRSAIPALLVLSSVFAYGFVLPWLGFLITTFLFSFLLFFYGYPRRFLLAVLGAAVTSISTVLVFEVWLKIQFPHGLIGV